MKQHRATQWSRFGPCPQCGVHAGQRCEAVSGRWLQRPHQGRHRIGYLPTEQQQERA